MKTKLFILSLLLTLPIGAIASTNVDKASKVNAYDDVIPNHSYSSTGKYLTNFISLQMESHGTGSAVIAGRIVDMYDATSSEEIEVNSINERLAKVSRYVCNERTKEYTVFQFEGSLDYSSTTACYKYLCAEGTDDRTKAVTDLFGIVVPHDDIGETDWETSPRETIVRTINGCDITYTAVRSYNYNEGKIYPVADFNYRQQDTAYVFLYSTTDPRAGLPLKRVMIHEKLDDYTKATKVTSDELICWRAWWQANNVKAEGALNFEHGLSTWFTSACMYRYTSDELDYDLNTMSQLNIKYDYNVGLTKLTGMSDIISGKEYLISVNDGGVSRYANGFIGGTVSIDGFSLSTDYTTALKFRFVLKDGYYSLKLSDNQYICGDGLNLFIQDHEDSLKNKWTVSYDGNYFDIVSYASNNKRHLGLYNIDYIKNTQIANGATRIELWAYDSTPNILNVTEHNIRFSTQLTKVKYEQVTCAYPENYKCGYMVCKPGDKSVTFDAYYRNLNKETFVKDLDPVATIVNGATSSKGKYSEYGNTLAVRPTEISTDLYEFSINVSVPEANLADDVLAVFYVYNTVTKDFIFSNEKVMSIKTLVKTYDGMSDSLSDHQNAIIDYMIAKYGWND